jgi:hypothetical protein
MPCTISIWTGSSIRAILLKIKQQEFHNSMPFLSFWNGVGDWLWGCQVFIASVHACSCTSALTTARWRTTCRRLSRWRDCSSPWPSSRYCSTAVQRRCGAYPRIGGLQLLRRRRHGQRRHTVAGLRPSRSVLSACRQRLDRRRQRYACDSTTLETTVQGRCYSSCDLTPVAAHGNPGVALLSAGGSWIEDGAGGATPAIQHRGEKKIGVGGLGAKWRVQGVFWKSDQWLAPWRVFVWKILPPPLAYSQVDWFPPNKLP